MVYHRFPGLQINLYAVGIAEMFDYRNKSFDIVIRARNVMSAAEIDPL